jgi:hypothetical protein
MVKAMMHKYVMLAFGHLDRRETAHEAGAAVRKRMLLIGPGSDWKRINVCVSWCINAWGKVHEGLVLPPEGHGAFWTGNTIYLYC